ncbi:MAG: ATP-binding cassette domain-containing protein [Bacilli bacterium]
MIKVTNLNKYFFRHKSNELHVINNTTIEFPQTGLVAILGESGCGKTTLMNVLGGLDRFDSGTIEIDNQKIAKYNSHKMDHIRNEKIGYIFQNYLLLNQETVYNNLMLTLNMYDLTDVEKNERIDYVLSSVGMLKQKKKKVAELSGGQQQRVAIARALIKAPSLILADEPTGNLDEKNTLQIMNIIKKISENTLVILVSHERSIANSYADYIIEIQDGKVVSSNANENASSYNYTDDLTLHLKDYSKKVIDNDFATINYYTKGSQKVNLNIVYENGKYYISSPDKVLLVDESSEITMVDDHKQLIDIENSIKENDFHLTKLTYKKTPRLSFKEQCKIALRNLKLNKKRSIFIYISLIIISCLSLWCVQSMFSANYIDIKNLASSDSHLYTVNISKGDASTTSTTVLTNAFNSIYNGFRDKYSNISIVPARTYSLNFCYDSFLQVGSTEYRLDNITFVPVDEISDDCLIYGKMPTNPTEIVVDEWVLEKLLSSTNLYNVIPISGFINQEFVMKIENVTLTISGIVRTNNNTIYASKWLLLDSYPSYMKAYGKKIIPLSEYKKYQEADQSLTLASDEVYTTYNVTHGYTENINMSINEDANMTYKVKDEVSLFNNCPFDIIVPDEISYQQVLASVMAYNHDKISLYCQTEEEMQAVISYFDGITKYYAEEAETRMIISHESVYNNSLKPHYETAKKTVSSRTVIMVATIFVSILIIYFSMRSFAIKSIYDMGVYRACGINKGSIILIYGLEMTIIGFFSCIIGPLLFTFIMNFITAIPVLMGSVGIEFRSLIITSLSLFVLDIFVGILPILTYMRLTPSELLSKYDI